MKLDWNKRSTYMYTWLFITFIIGFPIVMLVDVKYCQLAACLVISSLVFDMATFALIMHFFPKVKEWWFKMEV